MRSISHIRSGLLWPLLLTVAALLIAGFAAGCGGDDDGADQTATTQADVPAATTGGDEAETAPSDGGGKQGEKASGKGAKQGDGGGGDGGAEAPAEGSGDGGGTGTDSDDGEADEVEVPPNRHKDSGGGSKQFRTKGGDNSIQDSGKEADSGTFDEVAAIVHAFLDSRAAANAEVSCRYLASSITDQLREFASQSPEAPDTCAGLVDAFTVPMDAKTKRRIAQADIGSVRVKGDTAFVLYRGAENLVYVLPMAREDGQWKVAALAGSPMP